MKNLMIRFLEDLFYPKTCLICSIPGETFFCTNCFKNLFKVTKCVKCGGNTKGFDCKLCSNLFECDRFYIIGKYFSYKNFIYKNKVRPEFSEFTGFCLSDFLKSTEIRADNICFVPSRKTDHWLQFYLNKVDRARVFAPLVKNPLKLSQKLLNRSDRIENSMNLFRGSDDFKQNLNSILLIDDVLSTGNSLQSAIKELKSLGYKNISVLVFTYQEIRQGDRRK